MTCASVEKSLRNKLKLTKTEKIPWDFKYLIPSFMLFGFLLFSINFVKLEKILWNRVVYSSGSLWENASPIYENTDFPILIEMLEVSFYGILIGSSFVFIGCIFHISRLFSKKFDEFQDKAMIIISLLTSLFLSFFGFWLQNSIRIIAGLESEKVGGISGSEWIYGELGDYYEDLTLLGNIVWITFSIIFLILVILYFYRIYQQKRDKSLKSGNTKNIHGNNERSISFWGKLKQISFAFFGNLPFYAILILYLLFSIYPLYLTIKISVSTYYEINNALLPKSIIDSMILNYSSVIFATSEQAGSFLSAFKYSVFIGVGTGILGLTVSLTAAYALARFKFAGNKFLTFLILTTQMFPGMILLIPQYLIWDQLGLLDNNVEIFGGFYIVHIGLLLASAGGATAYCTWMMKGYFETIPEDIEEAALIDGSSRFSTFIKIAIPLAKSGIVAVLVFTFLTAWQDFILAQTFISRQEISTLPLLFYDYQDLNQPNAPIFYELLAPYAIMVAFPIVLFFMILQKQLAAGAVAGGIK